MCQVAASNESRSSSTLIEASNGCNWVFNEVSLTQKQKPWCHAMVLSVVLMSINSRI